MDMGVLLLNLALLSNFLPTAVVPFLFLRRSFRVWYAEHPWRNALLLGLFFGVVRAGIGTWGLTKAGYPLGLYMIIPESISGYILERFALFDWYDRLTPGDIAALVMISGPVAHSALFVFISLVISFRFTMRAEADT